MLSDLRAHRLHGLEPIGPIEESFNDLTLDLAARLDKISQGRFACRLFCGLLGRLRQIGQAPVVVRKGTRSRALPMNTARPASAPAASGPRGASRDSAPGDSAAQVG